MKFSTASMLVSASFATISFADNMSQNDYDTETQMLKDNGLCRLYDNNENPDYSKWQDLCKPMCGSLEDMVAATGGDEIVSST